MVRKAFSLVFLLCWMTAMALPSAAQEMTLQADSLDYDPARGVVRAAGNVTLTRDGVVLVAPNGEGAVGGGEFHLWGKVSGAWKDRGMDLKADDVTFRDGGSGRLEAKGNALLVSGGDRLEADLLTWPLGSHSDSSASGNVRGSFGERAFRAASFERQGADITVREVAEMADPVLRGSLSAPLIRGKLAGSELESLEASGGVTMKMDRGSDGPVKVTGQKALYSRARGTLVVSGSARAVQKDRIISADSIVLHMESGRIEALGSPKLTFPLGGEGDR